MDKPSLSTPSVCAPLCVAISFLNSILLYDFKQHLRSWKIPERVISADVVKGKQPLDARVKTSARIAMNKEAGDKKPEGNQRILTFERTQSALTLCEAT